MFKVDLHKTLGLDTSSHFQVVMKYSNNALRIFLNFRHLQMLSETSDHKEDLLWTALPEELPVTNLVSGLMCVTLE